MIRIQPEKSYLPAEHHFGTCVSPSSCGTPSTCSNNHSCKPSVCPDDTKKPKPKPKHHEDEGSGDIMKLTDLKNMLAGMQIKMAIRHPEIA